MDCPHFGREVGVLTLTGTWLFLILLIQPRQKFLFLQLIRERIFLSYTYRHTQSYLGLNFTVYRDSSRIITVSLSLFPSLKQGEESHIIEIGELSKAATSTSSQPDPLPPSSFELEPRLRPPAPATMPARAVASSIDQGGISHPNLNPSSASLVSLPFLSSFSINRVAGFSGSTEPEVHVIVSMWLDEVSSCSCLTVLAGPAGVLLNKIRMYTFLLGTNQSILFSAFKLK